MTLLETPPWTICHHPGGQCSLKCCNLTQVLVKSWWDPTGLVLTCLELQVKNNNLLPAALQLFIFTNVPVCFYSILQPVFLHPATATGLISAHSHKIRCQNFLAEARSWCHGSSAKAHVRPHLIFHFNGGVLIGEQEKYGGREMGSFGRGSRAGLFVHLRPKDNPKTIPQVPSTLSGSNIFSVLRSFKTFLCWSSGRFRIFFFFKIAKQFHASQYWRENTR